MHLLFSATPAHVVADMLRCYSDQLPSIPFVCPCYGSRCQGTAYNITALRNDNACIHADWLASNVWMQVVQGFNAAPAVHGILVQLPLPKHINEQRILDAVSYEKDVDGFHPQNIGCLAMRTRDPLFICCTPKVMYLHHCLTA